MVDFAQTHWVAREKEPIELLKAWYDFKDLKSFSLKKIGASNGVVARITCVVKYEAFTNKIDTKEITANVIKENGKWGVNPLSVLQETLISEEKL